MPININTPERRRVRVEALLSENSVKTLSKGAKNESLLTGVMLNVANRHAKGKTLSPLETHL